MSFTKFLLLFFSLSYNPASPLIYDYYWREFNGKIPKDAVIAGEDINGKKIYIGQGCVPEHGLFVGEIQSEQSNLMVPIRGVKNVTVGIKILCKPIQTKFKWIPVKQDNLHLIENHVVIGGLEFTKSAKFTNIGRIFYQQETQVGKVNSFHLQAAKFHFVHDDYELNASEYQVLVSNQNTIINKFEMNVEGYYWREYNGLVPKDALFAGTGQDDNFLYIGQAFIQNEGIIGTEIQSGKQIIVPVSGVKVVTSGVKVLCCENKGAFSWDPVNATSVNSLILDSGWEKVVGGIEQGQIAHIGRIRYDGYMKIGKINSFGSNYFHAVDKNREISETSYEILLFNKNYKVGIKK